MGLCLLWLSIGIQKTDWKGDRFMGAMYWIYHDTSRDIRYYTEAYTMSLTAFAAVVSEIVGHRVSASETSYADRQKDLDKFRNLKHI